MKLNGPGRQKLEKAELSAGKQAKWYAGLLQA